MTVLHITHNLSIPLHDMEFLAIRSQGAGGQNVNKVASAIHLRFDVRKSSLPEYLKSKILASRDRRISTEGIIVIKAQEYRRQEKNRQAALARLKAIVLQATKKEKVRKPTRASRASHEKRLQTKNIRGRTKNLRKKVRNHNE